MPGTTVWRLTALGRSLLDFQIMLDADHGPFFRKIETLQSLFAEQKRLETKINIWYFLSFVGALLVLSGPLPEGTKFSAFGVEAPLAVLPQQVLAVVTAVIFSQYATLFLSLIILGEMVKKVLQKEGHESWQFFSAPFDATSLWSVVLTPKLVGYRSSKREMGISLLVCLVAVVTVCAHAAIVVAATWVALQAALSTHSRFLVFLGGASLTISAVAALAFVACILLPLPYRWSGPVGEDGTPAPGPKGEGTS